jgi:flagellar basal body rod protein FlgC
VALGETITSRFRPGKASSGLALHLQLHLDAITNNVANADTTTATPGSSPAINGAGG